MVDERLGRHTPACVRAHAKISCQPLTILFPKVLISINYSSLPGGGVGLASSPSLRRGYSVSCPLFAQGVSRPSPFPRRTKKHCQTTGKTRVGGEDQTPSIALTSVRCGEGGRGTRKGRGTVSSCLQLLCAFPPDSRRQHPVAGCVCRGVPDPSTEAEPCVYRSRLREFENTEPPWTSAPQSCVQPPPPSSGLGYKSRPDLVLPLPGELEIQGDTGPEKPGPRLPSFPRAL